MNDCVCILYNSSRAELTVVQDSLSCFYHRDLCVIHMFKHTHAVAKTSMLTVVLRLFTQDFVIIFDVRNPHSDPFISGPALIMNDSSVRRGVF